MQDFEKLGVFYLGKEYDPRAGATKDDLILYDAKDLTTHAVCLGMTGSGKTGLCVALLEEAAIDGIPAICIDPKGDIANILLAFPDLNIGDFQPWIDPADAARNGASVEEYAAKTADKWRKGLADWGQTPARIQKLRETVEMAVYTPGNAAGRPLALVSSFEPPPAAILADPAALRDRIMSAVSGLMGLLGIAADPVQSREHILLSNILAASWAQGRGLDLAGLIQAVQKPPFEKIGILDLESFYPAKERFGLAMSLNNLLASPGFAAWTQGEKLDVQRLLYTDKGKPRLSVISIAHLGDAERMFFVTLLLNEVLAWVRQQSGTSSLRALLYMDEIFGYFPPNAAPPSKLPMLTLLKQARAFGVGIVLATQNPVDLDYKGLANTGTWFIGRLQTERDKMRVIEGLESAAASGGGGFDRAEMEALLAGLGQRVFLMRNVHEDHPVLMQTRWALTYLRGPMTTAQIQQLGQVRGASAPSAPTAAAASAPSFEAPPTPVAAPPAGRPTLPPEIPEFFLRSKGSDGKLTYKPRVGAAAKLHFVDAKAGLDTWLPYSFLAPLSDDGKQALWDEGEKRGDLKNDVDREPAPAAVFDELPAGAARAANAKAWQGSLEDFINQNVTLDLFACPEMKLTAKPGESEGDFKARLAVALREARDLEVEKIRKKYAAKLTTLQDQIRRAGERIEREKSQMSNQTMSTVLSAGAALFGAFLGRKAFTATNISKAATAMKSATRIGSEKQDVARAEENATVLQQRLEELNATIEQETAGLQAKFDVENAQVVQTSVRPRKSDISIGQVALIWQPWRVGADGMTEPAG